MSDESLVLPSAGRHGVSDADAVHAWTHFVEVFDVGEGMAMYIGPDRAGRLLEVGVVEWHGEAAIVHAMPARRKFLGDA